MPKFGGEPSTTSQEVDGEMSTLTRLPQSEPIINISFRIVKIVRISLAKNMMKILIRFLRLSIARCEMKAKESSYLYMKSNFIDGLL